MTQAWTVTKCEDGVLMVHTPGDTICFSDPNHGPDDPNDKKNFALISTAPELLAACVESVRKVEAGEAKSIRSYQQMKIAIDKARRMI